MAQTYCWRKISCGTKGRFFAPKQWLPNNHVNKYIDIYKDKEKNTHVIYGHQQLWLNT